MSLQPCCSSAKQKTHSFILELCGISAKQKTHSFILELCGISDKHKSCTSRPGFQSTAGSSVAVAADISVRSSRKWVIFCHKEKCFLIKSVPKRFFFNFGSEITGRQYILAMRACTEDREFGSFNGRNTCITAGDFNACENLLTLHWYFRLSTYAAFKQAILCADQERNFRNVAFNISQTHCTTWSASLVLFLRKYQWGRSANYLFSLSNKLLLGSKYPEKRGTFMFNFENRSIGQRQWFSFHTNDFSGLLLSYECFRSELWNPIAFGVI